MRYVAVITRDIAEDDLVKFRRRDRKSQLCVAKDIANIDMHICVDG
jgi:hypothetical protein